MRLKQAPALQSDKKYENRRTHRVRLLLYNMHIKRKTTSNSLWSYAQRFGGLESF